MSDEEITEEQQEQRLAARDKIAEAIGEYADSFDGSSGALTHQAEQSPGFAQKVTAAQKVPSLHKNALVARVGC